MEGNSYWHGSAPTEAQFQAALDELQKGAALWQN
jgi:hypothetical protein